MTDSPSITTSVATLAASISGLSAAGTRRLEVEAKVQAAGTVVAGALAPSLENHGKVKLGSGWSARRYVSDGATVSVGHWRPGYSFIPEVQYAALNAQTPVELWQEFAQDLPTLAQTLAPERTADGSSIEPLADRFQSLAHELGD